MNEYSIIGIILAIIGIFKGQDIWTYLTKRAESKNKGSQDLLEHLKNDLKECKENNESIRKRLEKYITKSRGNK